MDVSFPEISLHHTLTSALDILLPVVTSFNGVTSCYDLAFEQDGLKCIDLLTEGDIVVFCDGSYINDVASLVFVFFPSNLGGRRFHCLNMELN